MTLEIKIVNCKSSKKEGKKLDCKKAEKHLNDNDKLSERMSDT